MPIARRTEAAESDLQNIAYQIAFTSGQPILADKIIDELIVESEMLAAHSAKVLMGTAASEIGEGVRLFSCERWVIVFRYQPHGIDVLRFADGSQEYLAWKLG